MLTDRQRWDIMRSMIKQKNEEYNSFLFRFFDSMQIKQIAGTVRDYFLGQCRITGDNLVVGLEDHATKSSTKLSKTSWIDNLSSEDLLILLDYRCRVLQDMYKHYKIYQNITKHDVRYICANTAINKLGLYNNGRLSCGGRPDKAENELSVKDLGIDNYKLQQIAVNQTADELMERCFRAKSPSRETLYKLASMLTTYNVDPVGHITGYKYNVNNSEFFEFAYQEHKPKHTGFDIQGSPVYEYNNEYYSSAGSIMQNEDLVFKSLDDEFTQ